MNNFEDLKVWKKAHELVLLTYKHTEQFPAKEKFRLADQVCRSVSSVAANIVEGNSRASRKEYSHFINMSYASLQETKYHLLLARDLGYLNELEYLRLIGIADEVGKMLNSLQKYLKSKT